MSVKLLEFEDGVAAQVVQFFIEVSGHGTRNEENLFFPLQRRVGRAAGRIITAESDLMSLSVLSLDGKSNLRRFKPEWGQGSGILFDDGFPADIGS